jgi:hypothetical protein
MNTYNTAIHITTARQQLEEFNPVIYRYAFNGSKWRRFELMRDVLVQLPQGLLLIEKGFMWDLSSVPAMFWWFMKPFGRYDLAYLKHDHLYQNKGNWNRYFFTRPKVFYRKGWCGSGSIKCL